VPPLDVKDVLDHHSELLRHDDSLAPE